MPNWITIFHAIFNTVTIEHGGKLTLDGLLIAAGLSIALILMVAVMVCLTENARSDIGNEHRCANTKTALKALFCSILFIALGNYGGILVAAAAIGALCYLIFCVGKGIKRSIGSCKTTTS